ncbi:hypothetical protein J4471_03990 [Candidatus Woesearchaeota archaeon]|nr:hypothetical protein [Candidatus Woesearchaeota archaeon]
MKFNKFLPYLLPTLSIVVLSLILIIKPEITGFAVVDQDKEMVSSKVTIFLDKDSMLPVESIVLVSLDNQEGTMSLIKFIERSKEPKTIIDGDLKEIGYVGKGYTGVHQYSVDLQDFGLGLVQKSEVHSLNIRIIYDGKVLLENNRTIKGLI